MSKFTVAIAGGGIGGLCLAGALLRQEKNIKVDVYEASKKFDEVGAGLTLWGRVCEVLYLMGLADDCIKASVVSATTNSLTKGSTGFHLRGFKHLDRDYGALPMRNAWSMHRKELQRILLSRVPRSNIHLNKRILSYQENDRTGIITLRFSDGTHATCDILIGCDGIRSNTRAQMMRNEARRTGIQDFKRYITPRWTGNIAYRFLIPRATLVAKDPKHRLLTGGQIYFGKSRHIIAYPISKTMLNGVVSVTDFSKADTPWLARSWNKELTREETASKIRSLFTEWHPEGRQIIETVGSTMELAIHDLEPLPFYARGRIALLGDSAHAAVPYTGASAALALEDAFVLSRILGADLTTRTSLPLALKAYQDIRLPYGNRHIVNAREALRAFQHSGPDGNDMSRVQQTIYRIFEESATIGASSPEADAAKAIAWLERKLFDASGS